MVQVVSPCWKYCDWVVIVLVTLQDVAPNATTANAVNKIIFLISAPFVFEIWCKSTAFSSWLLVILTNSYYGG